MGYGFVCGRRRLPLSPVPDQAAGFITAPSMTTPWVTYFHKRHEKLARQRHDRALAALLLRYAALNQRVRADCGWWRIHSQASWIIVVRSRGLPAFDTPCSCAIAPLCQGVAARPA